MNEEMINMSWLLYVNEWQYLKADHFNSSFSLKQKMCLESTKQAIQEYRSTKEETPIYKCFQNFWSKIHFRLGSPTLVMHELCNFSCLRELMQIAIFLYPNQLSIRDKNGKLPLHIALDNRKSNILYHWIEDHWIEEWNLKGRILSVHKCDVKKKELPDTTKAELLLEYYPDALREKDEILDIYPYMMAAKNSDLSLCYKILCMNPEVFLY